MRMLVDDVTAADSFTDATDATDGFGQCVRSVLDVAGDGEIRSPGRRLGPAAPGRPVHRASTGAGIRSQAGRSRSVRMLVCGQYEFEAVR